MSIRVLVFPSANEPGLEILQALAKSNKIELLAGSSFQGKRQLLLTKNVDPEAALARLSLPRLFEEVRGVVDKPAGVSALVRDWDLDPARCVMINDSITENLAIQALHPTLRVVQPDALDLLQREKLR